MDSTMLSIVVGLWTATNTVFSGLKIINDKRDTILTGSDGRTNLSIEHRRLMLRSDWVPMNFGMAVICVVFGAVIMAIPWISASTNRTTVIFCVICSLVPFASGVSFVVCGLWDLQEMNRVLDSHQLTKS